MGAEWIDFWHGFFAVGLDFKGSWCIIENSMAGMESPQINHDIEQSLILDGCCEVQQGMAVSCQLFPLEFPLNMCLLKANEARLLQLSCKVIDRHVKQLSSPARETVLSPFRAHGAS